MDASAQELVVANFILPLLKDFLSPRIEALLRKNKVQDDTISALERNFEIYMAKRFGKYVFIDTLAFPNKQTLFEILYQPLTLTSKGEKGASIEILIDGYPSTLLPVYYRVIVEDTAGMGKSTIIKKLFLSIIKQKAGIPILIELRQINKENSILKEITSQLFPNQKENDVSIIQSLIEEGQFVFLFDGFDEISLADKKFVLNDMHTFINQFEDNYFLITSRPENSLSSFGDFKKFHVRPLLQNEAFNLIERYDNYSHKQIAKDLINQLENHEQDELEEYLTNPLLVSLLYKSYEYKKDIPIKKSQFYRQVYEALFESHDLSKEGYLKRDKYCNLHIDDFEKVLRYVAYFTAIENKVEYDKNYIINAVEKVKKYFNELNFKASDFVSDLLITVPIFKKDGNYLRWSHKSLQDYFAAKFIWIDAKENQELILRKIYEGNTERFSNILDIFCELDTKTFEETILFWILTEFKNFCDTTYIDCREIDADLINQRKQYSFNKDAVFVIVHSTQDKKGKRPMEKEARAEVQKLPEYASQHYTYLQKDSLVLMNFQNQENNKKAIMKIISDRFPNLAQYFTRKIDLNEIPVMKPFEHYKLDDFPTNVVNLPKVFSEINHVLADGYCFLYRSALDKLEQLNDAKKPKGSNEFLDW